VLHPLSDVGTANVKGHDAGADAIVKEENCSRVTLRFDASSHGGGYVHQEKRPGGRALRQFAALLHVLIRHQSGFS